MKKGTLYLLFLLVASSIRGQNVPYQAPVNPEFLEYQTNLQGSGVQSSNEAHGETWMIPEMVRPYFPSGKSGRGSNPTVLPSYYDLRSIGMMSSVKDQGACTSGWAFAVMAALELAWTIYETYDTNLSENNLKNCHGFNRGPCSGGNIKMATSYLSRLSGPVSESSDPYVPSIQACLTGLPPLACVPNIRFLPNDIQTIKQELYDYMAIYSTLYWTNSSFDATNFTYFYNGTSTANHAITIVGWDDLKVTAGGTGAWIAKNSFGAGWGESGYFYISYNDSRILSENACFPNPSRITYRTNSTLYFYDDLGWVQSWGYENEEAYGLVKFVAANDYSLASIGTWVVAGSSMVDIEVYDTFDGAILSTLLLTMPTHECIYPGYYSFDLPYGESLNLTPGNDYYIQVKYTTPGCNNPIPSEMVAPNYSTNATIQTGKCWMSGDGITWDAVGQGTPYMLDLCIKAYTYKSMDPPYLVFASMQIESPQHAYLFWYYPYDHLGLTGFNVYRDNILLNSSPIPADPNNYWQDYSDYNVPFCEHTYTVTAVYGSTESVPSNSQSIMVGQRTVIRESFEYSGDISPGWAIENVFNPSGETLISFIVQSPYYPQLYAYDSNYFVRFACTQTIMGERVRLKRYIPVSTIGLSNVSISFAWYESSYSSWADNGVEIQWSTDGNSWNTAASFLRYNETDGWKEKEVDLPPEAAGQSAIYIGFLFKAVNDESPDCFLDLAKVTTCGPPLPGYLVVGTGNSGVVEYPFSTGNMDARTQSLYHQDEILSAGGYPGLITKIGYYMNTTPSLQVMHNFQIKLKNTTQTSLDNWVTDGMTTVYSGDYQVSSWPYGWHMITLESPFYYDTTNLLVEICFDNDSYTNNTYVQCGYYPNSNFHHRFDGFNSSGCNTTDGNVSNYLPWLRLYMTPEVLPVTNLQNITTASNQSNCFDATQTITLAGSGTTFTVKNGGNVNLIAGHNILFYPGADVQSGGYLHGYITTSGQYCGSLKTSLVTNPENRNPDIPAASEGLTNPLFRIYPNPTTGNFILELTGEVQYGKIAVEIYGTWGEKVLSTTLNGERKQELSLSDKPTGVYFIRVVTGEKTETLKIIRQ